jgi:hypothetical protein
MIVTSAPNATVRQVSGYDPDVKPLLAVVVKRTWRVDRTGRCVPHEKQTPLFDDIVVDEASGAVLHDPDLFPLKPLTDVVVLGHAYAREGERSLRAAIFAAGATKAIHVVGDRRCTLDPFGNVVFSEPAPFEVMPLGYEHAYGGRDMVAESRYGTGAGDLQAYLPTVDLAAASPWRYPRNPLGRGYLVEATPEGIEALALPNLEDPADLLTPARLAARYATLWPAMPLPASPSWVDAGTFPRCAWVGAVPDHQGFEGPFPEAARGLLPPDFTTAASPMRSLHPRFTNGAAPELQRPHLRGDEEFVLARLHPTMERWSFRLPGVRPAIWTDGRNGRLQPTEVRLHTVLIEPDHDRVTTVWCGSAPALRPYLPDELARMPLRVEE